MLKRLKLIDSSCQLQRVLANTLKKPLNSIITQFPVMNVPVFHDNTHDTILSGFSVAISIDSLLLIMTVWRSLINSYAYQMFCYFTFLFTDHSKYLYYLYNIFIRFNDRYCQTTKTARIKIFTHFTVNDHFIC